METGEESRPLFSTGHNRTLVPIEENHFPPFNRNNDQGLSPSTATSPLPSDTLPTFLTELPDRPLFGVSNKRDRAVNLVVGFVTALLFMVTLICSFLAPHQGHNWPPLGLNIFFAICICFVFVSHIILIYWYRQGDLDPKFRLLIYYNAFSMVILSICALTFFFGRPLEA